MKNKLLVFKLILVSLILSNSFATRILKRSRKGLSKAPKGWISESLRHSLAELGYELQKKSIREGKFIVVFKAEKNMSEYALKLMYIGSDERRKKRFAEAKIQVQMAQEVSDSAFTMPICDHGLIKENEDFGPFYYAALPLAVEDLSKEIIYPRKIEKKLVKRTLIQMALAVRDLHKQEIIHRNINLKNFLRMKGGRVMLSDFRMAIKKEDVKADTPVKGAAFFTPYDAKDSYDYKYLLTEKVDVFALGLSMEQYLNVDLNNCLEQKRYCVMTGDDEFNMERSLTSNDFFSKLQKFYSFILGKTRKLSDEELEFENFIFTRMLVKHREKKFLKKAVFRASIEEVVEKLQELYPKEFEAVERKYGAKRDYCK